MVMVFLKPYGTTLIGAKDPASNLLQVVQCLTVRMSVPILFSTGDQRHIRVVDLQKILAGAVFGTMVCHLEYAESVIGGEIL